MLALGPIVGCGGGGTSGGPPPPNIVRYAVEATKGGVIIDPTNIAAGETVQFVVAGYTASNQRTVVSSSEWSLDATGQSEGSISASGQFAATTAGPAFNVFAMSGGQQRIGVAQVRAAGQAFVTGRLIDGRGSNLSGLRVDFYDATSALVGTSFTQYNGTFRAIVPVSAVTFEVSKNYIPVGYYKEYFYASKWFLPLGLCRAPLPLLTAGVSTALLTDVTVPPTTFNGSSLPPPPPPSPCG